MRRRASLPLALAALLMSTAASASPGYPGALKTDLGVAYTPGCGLCHHAASTPVGPADTLFGKSMIAKGLVGQEDTASLAKALDGLRAGGIDSDGDGAKDLDELSWGGDPNHADVPESGDSDPVTYGCSWGRQPVDGAGVGIFFGMMAVLAARRGRRRSA
jgi:cytochrome c551/c552